jgi:NAD(P)-dependent dehydrogenase (short-subunit alcohol dehydrogenase family)
LPANDKSGDWIMADKVAFVTGAGSGIGRATAKMFAARGYAVAICDVVEDGGRATEAMVREAGGEGSFIRCDVSDDGSVKAAVDATLARYGRLDAAFNAAGIGGEVGVKLGDCSMDNWHRVIAVNLTGVWHCMRHQIPAMLAQGGGAIVNCASTAGIDGAAYCGVYSASKHGVVGLTKTAALEYARAGIRVNAVCPGMIRTPMTQAEGMKEVCDTLAAGSPMGRLGEPEEIAGAVLYLCGPDASFVHGQAIPVDGAWTSQ